MNATRAAIDLDDTEALIGADHDGLLRAASMAGAQVRTVAAAVEEGALDALGDRDRPRTVIWVAGRGAAGTAGAMLAAATGGVAAEPIVTAAEVPPWIGALDVLVVAGDDPGDPALVAAAATGVRRGARVVVVAPYEGPLRDSTAGRVAVLEPRFSVPDGFGLCRYLAAGLAVLGRLDAGLNTELAALADELDAETLRNSAGRDVLTNAAKALAERIVGRRVVLAGNGAATLALARHGSAVLLRTAHTVAAAAGLADALIALHTQPESAEPADNLFHDPQIDGPLPDRLRVLALTLAAERTVVAARIGRLTDIDLVGVQDMPDAPPHVAGGEATLGPPQQPGGVGRAEQQLAVLAVRLEMAAVYVRLMAEQQE